MDKTDGAARRWTMLALATGSSAAAAMVMVAGGFLIPALLVQRGLSLPQAGLVAAMTSLGIMLTLIGWGFLIDRYGERWTLAAGLALAGLSTLAAAAQSDPRWIGGWFFVAGMAAGSTNAASGRIVVSWFPKEQRGLAMGIRQMAQPLGMGFDALVLPVLAKQHGVGAALAVPAVAVLVFAALAAMFAGLPETAGASPCATATDGANPYRAGSFLWLVHGVSVLLVIPQYFVWTYMFTWLNHSLSWPETTAGALVAAANVLGAAGRVAAGVWSDRVGSRTWTIRAIATIATAVLGCLALASWGQATASAVALMVAACAITSADNGLAFTSVAEFAGPRWSGRALGAQNTCQYIASFLVPPCFGWLIDASGYTWAFGVSAVIAAAAIPLVPKDQGDRALTGRRGER
ncbi:MAG: MFS transporter [Segniliparus sp.]|uniref:MFS transporter n=1 Tax=Segniliparus sp. TaxID=2804064 RepID=UPI003F32D32B